MNFKYFIILFFVGTSCTSLFGQLYINEWMASNSSVISDPDFDDTGDWIEIFNDYDSATDISGYFLTDNLGDPTKWTFPSGTILDAKSHLLIWADGRNVGIHADFKLTKDGEEIGLYSTDTLLIDEITYKFQKTNISMGRATDGSTSLGFFEIPTPGFSNDTKAYSGITFYEPRYSIGGGMHLNPVSVELTAIDGDVRYTMDGSQPTLDSEIYTSPIMLEETTIIRAAVFLENEIAGKPITNTYFFEPTFQDRNLPVISISSDPDYFWDETIGLYVQDFKPTWEYPINIELFENDGSDRAAFNELAGTKVNGLNSWILPQKMLGIYFDNDYDKNNLEYQLFFDEDRKRFDNFILRASGSDWGNTLFRDALCQGLTSENMNLEKMAFRPSMVYINGEYMGIHNMRARIDEGFIEENFGYAAGEYDLIENNGTVEEGDDIAFYDLFKLFDNDMSVASNYEEISTVVDLENLTDYFIAEIWSSNSSWGHNIQMWKPKASGTKWRWILQDLDRGFTGIGDELISKFTTSMSPSGYNWARIPLNSLFQNEGFSQQFAQRFADHLYTTFHPNRVISFIEKHKHLIDQEIPYHSDRWAGTTSIYGNGLPSVEYWEGEVSELVDFANGRPAVMISDIKNRFGLSDATNLTTINNPKDAGQISINELPIPSSPWQGQYFQNMPFQLEAKPQTGQEFLGWSSAQYETIVNKKSEWKYLDDGSDQGTAWKENDFDDSSWTLGSGKFGYGDEDEDTTISFGGDSNNKYVTTYFRKDFNIDDISALTGALSFDLLRDDGAIVYLNGKEIIRSNLPLGNINANTLALTFASGDEEVSYFNFLIAEGELKEGNNTIAVEVHQSQTNSSDLGFDLSFKALKVSNGNFISTERQIEVTLNSDSILVANYESSEVCTLPKVISANTTLELACSPYYAVSEVVVDSAVTLTIEEGVQIYFPKNKNLEIRGSLMINGSEDLPVHITALEGDDPWGGIIFKNASDSSSLNHLEISKASNGNHPIYENAAISAFHSTVEMNKLTIVDVESNPILAYYSDIILRNSELHSKVTGDLINVKYGNGQVLNSSFRGNSEIDTDAIDFDGVMDGKIIGNKIYNFLGFNSDGIDIGEETTNVLIEGNFIHNCTDKGISIGQISTLNAVHNVIVNCDLGIAVKDQSSALIEQNTFYNVTTPVSCFEKNIGLGGGYSLVTNTIFSNSSGEPIQYDSVSQIVVTTSLSDTDSLPTTLNFLGNPLFQNPTFNDFSLQEGSIAIDGGADADNNIIDIGAAPNPYSADASLMITAIQYFPKEDQDAEFIAIYNPKDKAIDLGGYMLADAIDFTFPFGSTIEAGETILVALNPALANLDVAQKFKWTRGRLSNEGEKIVLIAPSGIVEDHVIYNNKSPWPLEAEGLGGYLKLIDINLDNHFAESWESSMSTSAKDLQKSVRTIKVFPNPTKDFVTIESIDQEIEQVEIINTVGQIVYSSSNKSSSITINIQSLESGIYFIRINGLMVQNSIILQK